MSISSPLNSSSDPLFQTLDMGIVSAVAYQPFEIKIFEPLLKGFDLIGLLIPGLSPEASLDRVKMSKSMLSVELQINLIGAIRSQSNELLG